jgi:hypothetical protein
VLHVHCALSCNGQNTCNVHVMRSTVSCASGACMMSSNARGAGCLCALRLLAIKNQLGLHARCCCFSTACAGIANEAQSLYPGWWLDSSLVMDVARQEPIHPCHGNSSGHVHWPYITVQHYETQHTREGVANVPCHGVQDWLQASSPKCR